MPTKLPNVLTALVVNFQNGKFLPTCMKRVYIFFTWALEYEVIITAEGNWKYILMGNLRIMDVDPTLLPQQVHDVSQLFMLMKSLESMKVCPGVPSDNYRSVQARI